MMANDKHKLRTGVENGRILNNLKMLVENMAMIHIRVPVIPGANDNIAEMQEIATFLQSTGGIELIELLPYHGFAESKYESLGVEYGYKGCKPPEKEYMKALLDVFLKKGLNARIKDGM
jgi:pyruvate formate lyase activating enzyme